MKAAGVLLLAALAAVAMAGDLLVRVDLGSFDATNLSPGVYFVRLVGTRAG